MKVQRPGAAEAIERDLDILRRLADLFDRRGVPLLLRVIIQIVREGEWAQPPGQVLDARRIVPSTWRTGSELVIRAPAR